MSGTGGAREQVNRLLALVPYLQRHGELPIAQVAREFGVSERTIRRDVNVLLFCGLPGLGMGDLIDVDFDALEGEKVLRLFNADYLTRPLRLDSTEAAALVVGLRTLAEGADESQREVVARTLAKIETAAGEAGNVAAQVDLRPAEAPEQARLRIRLTEATADRRQLRLRHRSPVRDEVTERVVDPIAVSTWGGHTYLDAWCHRVEDRRLFRLDRIEQADALSSRVTEQAALEPLDLREGIFRSSPQDQVATLLLTPRARWVVEYYPVEAVEELPDGGLRVRLRVGDPRWLVRLMLQLGDAGRVEEPADLVAAVRSTARQVLDQYAEDARRMNAPGSTSAASPDPYPVTPENAKAD